MSPVCTAAPAKVAAQPEKVISLTEARHGFETGLVRHESSRVPLPDPPANLARVVRYDSPAGKLKAYLTQAPEDGKRHPAIVWITGGDSSTLDASIFQPAPPEDDQTASAFRQAGIITMYPSLRGGNDNPGFKEGFFGEVDDVRAAADFLATQYSVDPQRIYLGGHSTGGTLALLVAESTDRFRDVFAAGPVDDVRRYGGEFLPFDTTYPREVTLRTPAHWLPSIHSPVFVFEGTEKPSNIGSLQAMEKASHNPLIHFHPVAGATHFTALAPLTRLIADKIVHDDGPATNIAFTKGELRGLFPRQPR
jgi:acetyl esterase/lipase